jgi:hypothetical protein
MPGNEKGSFWATTSGLTTGIAGTLTGVLGIVALANQAGWIGGDGGQDQAGSAATSESAAGSTATSADTDGTSTTEEDDRAGTTDDRASRSATTAEPVFSVSPSSVRFTALGARTATAAVRNTGEVDLDVQNVSVEGADASRFTVDATPCTSDPVEPDGDCEVEVTFDPGQGGGTAEATMVIDASGADSREVPLAGEPLL